MVDSIKDNENFNAKRRRTPVTKKLKGIYSKIFRRHKLSHKTICKISLSEFTVHKRNFNFITDTVSSNERNECQDLCTKEHSRRKSTKPKHKPPVSGKYGRYSARKSENEIFIGNV